MVILFASVNKASKLINNKAVPFSAKYKLSVTEINSQRQQIQRVSTFQVG